MCTQHLLATATTCFLLLLPSQHHLLPWRCVQHICPGPAAYPSATAPHLLLRLIQDCGYDAAVAAEVVCDKDAVDVELQVLHLLLDGHIALVRPVSCHQRQRGGSRIAVKRVRLIEAAGDSDTQSQLQKDALTQGTSAYK